MNAVTVICMKMKYINKTNKPEQNVNQPVFTSMTFLGTMLSGFEG